MAAVWLSGAAHIYKVTLHQAQLVLKWVTICRYTIVICKQPLRQMQPPTLSGMRNEYQPGAMAVLWR